MLKLKNVSKFYYNKGVVSSGIFKINLEFNMNEFVVITGESGSGKSTLLNVISGLDSYEEGEMYINGEETSYYTEKDFFDYRKRYIGNIFQNFNLINSYTVYENVELVLLINGFKSKDIREKVDNVLKQVGMYKYRNTKVSKLSGGEKQRVAIARTLAKDSRIIVTDEPTGNLDSKSAKNIVELLHEISKDKLVIVVTHNYEQFEKYATRRIKMHDGKVLEDTYINKKVKNTDIKESHFGKMLNVNKFKLGIRNTFNIVPKFLLLLLVYTFLSFAVLSLYASFSKSKYDFSNVGYNANFTDLSDKRIIIKRKDGKAFLDSDYEKIRNIKNVDYIVKEDAMIDMNFTLSNEEDSIWISASNISNFKGTFDYGEFPKEDNEIILEGSLDSYYFYNGAEAVIGKEFKLEDTNGSNLAIKDKLKIVGVKIRESTNLYNDNANAYFSSSVISLLDKSINKLYSKVNIIFNNNLFSSDMSYNIVFSKNVNKGEVVIPENMSYACKTYYCNYESLNISISNIYYNDNIDLNVSAIYTKDNFERLTGYSDIDNYYNLIFISEEDYYSLFDKGNYQSSIYMKNVKEEETLVSELSSMGYDTLYVKDTILNDDALYIKILYMVELIGIFIALIALFFISYLIIKVILKSRNNYYSTIRMLGATKKDIKLLLNIELNLVLYISYIIILIVLLLVKLKYIQIDYLNSAITYLKFTDFIILYLILFVISLFISRKYSKKLFSSSIMRTYKEV